MFIIFIDISLVFIQGKTASAKKAACSSLLKIVVVVTHFQTKILQKESFSKTTPKAETLRSYFGLKTTFGVTTCN